MESLWKILVVFGCVYFMKMYQVVWSRDRLPNTVFLGFPGGSDGKESACIVGDLSLIPGLGRSPRGRHGNPLQYSCLEKPHGQGSLEGYSPWCCKELDMTEQLSLAHQVVHLQFLLFFSMWSHRSIKFKNARPISEQWPDFQPQLCMEHRVWKDCSKVSEVKWSEAARSCPTLCNPMDYKPTQVSQSMGFSRQEYWSGVPFSSPKESQTTIQLASLFRSHDLGGPCPYYTQNMQKLSE